MNRNRKNLWRFVPAAAWMTLIFILSSRSGGELGSWLPIFQKLLPGLQSFDTVHYAAYFVLALTVGYGLGRFAFTWKGCWWIIGVCVAYGITDEWHQSYVPNRTPDVMDLRNDAIGAAVACLFIQLYRAIGYRRS